MYDISTGFLLLRLIPDYAFDSISGDCSEISKYSALSFCDSSPQLDTQPTKRLDENCETSNHFSICGNWFSSPDLLMSTKMAEKCEITCMKVNRGRTKQSPVYRTDASFASLFQPYYITCYYVKHVRRKRKAT
ncbi:hypothetical protein T06_9847 [Trichinella sp. T6]|nr:hypothetical protein T06_9847 [Trichinella sp. T6]